MTIPLAVGIPPGGTTQATVARPGGVPQVSFTAGSGGKWNVPQTVTVTPLALDAATTYITNFQILLGPASSPSDQNYDEMTIPPVQITEETSLPPLSKVWGKCGLVGGESVVVWGASCWGPGDEGGPDPHLLAKERPNEHQPVPRERHAVMAGAGNGSSDTAPVLDATCVQNNTRGAPETAAPLVRRRSMLFRGCGRQRGHVLRRKRAIVEPDFVDQAREGEPCGFCFNIDPCPNTERLRADAQGRGTGLLS